MSWSIGIDVGGSFIKYGLVNSRGDVVGFDQIKTPQKLAEFKLTLAKIVKGLYLSY